MRTVLVADDEFAVLEVLTMALESEGHRVLKAGDGADAWRILVSTACDIVVCDDVMPMMDGQALIGSIRADPRLADLPVVLMVESLGRGRPPVASVTTLVKPLKLAELARIVAAVPQRRTTKP